MGSPCKSIWRWAERPGRETGLTWQNQIGRLKSDAHARVQRTKYFFEYQPGLEAKDSFQTGFAPNEPINLDLEPLDNGASGELGQNWDRQISVPQVPICAPVNEWLCVCILPKSSWVLQRL